MIEIANIRDLTYILAHLRDADRVELRATMGEIGNYDLSLMLMQAGQSFICKIRNTPVAAFGASPMSPTTVNAWAFGTDRFPRAVPQITRFVLGPLRQHLAAKGYRWAEARVLTSHHTAIYWMEDHLDALVEARLRGFGTGGEDFLLMRRSLIDPQHKIG